MCEKEKVTNVSQRKVHLSISLQVVTLTSSHSTRQFDPQVSLLKSPIFFLLFLAWLLSNGSSVSVMGFNQFLAGVSHFLRLCPISLSSFAPTQITLSLLLLSQVETRKELRLLVPGLIKADHIYSKYCQTTNSIRPPWLPSGNSCFIVFLLKISIFNFWKVNLISVW